MPGNCFIKCRTKIQTNLSVHLLLLCKTILKRSLYIFPIGQVVSSEIVMGSEKGCPIEVHNIEIEKCDEMYDSECEGGKSIPFHRAGYDQKTGQSPNNPRQQVRIQSIFSKVF